MARLLKVALLVAAGALLYVTVSLFWPAPAGAATGTGTGPELESIGHHVRAGRGAVPRRQSGRGDLRAR